MTRRILAPALAVAALALSARPHAQDATQAAMKRVSEKLAEAKEVTCSFSLMFTSTWQADGTTKGEMKTLTTPMVLKFNDVDVDGGSAEMSGVQGKFDILVRQTEGGLHFIHSFRTGPFYSTSIFPREVVPNTGRYKAVHSRHEYVEVVLPGFTSRPEQYLGECQVTK